MNRLAEETSRYLIQHAGNPVDWYPWGEEALARARLKDRPILLSIGYSSCHWCHVMARESFQDDATAALMNERFVNIKVDREERPDLDRIYQLGHQLLMRQSGGWPLTAFLDPETLLPFFAGTYFPRNTRHGLPRFGDLLAQIADAYHARRADLKDQGAKLAEALARLEDFKREPADVSALFGSAREQLGSRYDAVEGGFGSAPKFPMAAAIERLLRHWARIHADRAQPPDREALNMAMTTLTKMARGGIYDHLGGGFYRYATDRRWMIPHFEKMLYDNGALLALYADALGLGPDLLFSGAVRETAAWLMREMQHPGGGYYASQDADSEGQEGRYYVWRRADVKRPLTEAEYLLVETLYGLDKAANFEGKWNLCRRDAWRSVVERLYLDPETAERHLTSAKAKLFAARRQRVPPGRDEKILAAWNGLTISGMVRAGLRVGEPAWIESAARAADFVRTRMVEDGRLYATWTSRQPGHPATTGARQPGSVARAGDVEGAWDGTGTAKYPAYLDDHALMLRALLALLSATWRDADLDFAGFLGDELLHRFQDPESGGFCFTAHDHERLIHRSKPTVDDALPAGNAAAARALLGLGHLTGELRYLEAAERALDWARGFVERDPVSHCALLTAVEESLRPPELIIIRGPPAAMTAWLDLAHSGYKPARAVYGIPYDAAQVPSYLPRLNSAETRARVSAFLCSGSRCSAPIADLEEFKRAIS